MIIYKGKYPKRTNMIYSIREDFGGGYGATLNDGTMVRLNVRALQHKMPRCGEELQEGTFEVIGQSKIRKGVQ